MAKKYPTTVRYSESVQKLGKQPKNTPKFLCRLEKITYLAEAILRRPELSVNREW
jgi:hypothetical protein